MRLPNFSAEESLYETTSVYISDNSKSGSTQGIEPHDWWNPGDWKKALCEKACDTAADLCKAGGAGDQKCEIGRMVCKNAC